MRWAAARLCRCTGKCRQPATTPAVSATLADALTTDVNNNSKANEGDKLTYTTTISSTGKDATNVQYNAPLDANTTLSGGVKTSAIAIEDNFATPFNTLLTGANVSLNDFGLPAKTVVSFGTTESGVAHLAGSAGATDNGGTLVVSANGSFTYTPPAGFTGYDRFSYALQAGVAPNDVATVTIAVGNAPSAGPAESFPGVIGNVRVNQAPSLLSNDGGDGLTIAAVNGNALASPAGALLSDPSATGKSPTEANSFLNKLVQFPCLAKSSEASRGAPVIKMGRRRYAPTLNGLPGSRRITVLPKH